MKGNISFEKVSRRASEVADMFHRSMDERPNAWKTEIGKKGWWRRGRAEVPKHSKLRLVFFDCENILKHGVLQIYFPHYGAGPLLGRPIAEFAGYQPVQKTLEKRGNCCW